MSRLLLAALVCACAWQAHTQQYTDRFDNTNLEVVIHNRRLLVPYVKCVLDQGKCTAEGNVLKEHLTDAMQTGCSKCTAKQRDGASLVIRHLILNEKELWQQLVDKYQAGDNIFVKKYETQALGEAEELEGEE